MTRLPGIRLDTDDWGVRPFLAYARLLARYHQHRVLHLDRIGALIRKNRRVILIGNHALDILDPLLFVSELLRQYGCLPCFVGHENLVFRFPGLREIALRYGMIPSRRMRETERALQRDGLLMLYPGSGSEAVRRVYRDEPYRLKWEGRYGFLRLAIRHDADIVFVAALGIDEMYYQSSLEVPTAMLRLFSSERYRGARFQFGLLGPHVLPALFPLPVQITHSVSPPFDLGDRAAARRSRHVLKSLHQRIWDECQSFLNQSLKQRDRDAPMLDRLVRGGEGLLRRMGL